MAVLETSFNAAGDQIGTRILGPRKPAVRLDYLPSKGIYGIHPLGAIYALARFPGRYQRAVQATGQDPETGQDLVILWPEGRVLRGYEEINAANISGVPKRPGVARVEVSATPNPPPQRTGRRIR